MKFLRGIFYFLFQPRIFFLIPAFVLVQLWFNKNLLFGGTEVGIPTYTPGKILEQIRWLWWEALGPGVSLPAVSASIPLYFLMNILERIGLNAINIQKILFFSIIYLQGLGASLIFKTTIHKFSRLQLLSGLFYIFNPFTMMVVWHRFIYANFILSASLPFFVYFYLRLLESGNIKFIFFFLLTSLLASYMYSSIAPVIAVWLSIFTIFVTVCLLNRRNFKKIVKMVFLTLGLLVSWILANLWWLYPLISTQTVLSVFSSKGNFDTLVTLSSQSTISNVLRGINPFVIFHQEDWGSIYDTTLFHFLSWISVLLVLLSFVKIYKSGKIWFMSLLFLFGVFVSKGAAEPLGKVFAWLYANIFLLGPIRNPFEKLGLLIFLPASILMAIGSENLWNLFNGEAVKRVLPKLLLIILICGYGVYLWPMGSDKLFGSEKYPPFSTIPKDYSEASAFLEKSLKFDNGKILHLPISEGDSATYKWVYTYNGVELASHLFPGSSISRLLYVSSIDSLLRDTARIFHAADYKLQRQILLNFGIKYIVLNKNLDWYSRSVDNPFFLEETLDRSPDLKTVFQSTNLKIYKFSQDFNPNIFTSGNITVVLGDIGIGNQSDFIFNKVADEKGILIHSTRRQSVPSQTVRREIIFPIRVINTALESAENTDVIIPRPFVKHLPNSIVYPLTILKEKFELLLTPPFEKSSRLVFLTQKRLIEARLLSEGNKKEEFRKAIKQYIVYLDNSIQTIAKLSDMEINTYEKIIFKSVFQEQQQELNDLLNKTADTATKKIIANNIEKINQFRKARGFESYYVYKNTGSQSGNDNFYISQFLLFKETKGDILLSIPNINLLTDNSEGSINLLVDGESKEAVVREEGSKTFSLGDITLRPGIHEITLKILAREEKIQIKSFTGKGGIVELTNDDSIIMTSSKENAWIEYPILDYNPDKTYILGMYFRIIRGTVPQIQIWQDEDELKAYKDPKVRVGLPESQYDFDWKYYELSISSNNNTSIRLDRNVREPVVRVFLPFWNNCEEKNLRNVKLCRNPDIRKGYNKPSSVEIKNVRIREAFSSSLFLNSVQNNSPSSSKQLNYKKVSPVEYEVKLEENGSPIFVVLNESFHPGWKIVTTDSGKQIVEEKKHFLTNGYANGWLMDQPTKRDFRIKFLPQEYLHKGAIVSALIYISLTVILIKQSLYKEGKNG